LLLTLLDPEEKDGSNHEPVVHTLKGKLLVRDSCAAPIL